MTATPTSLLERLKATRPEEDDWRRLHEMYFPLIARWLDRVPGLGDEAADLTQEVFLVVVREIPNFERRREGSFRAWLRLVTVNRIRTHRKQLARRPGTGLDPADSFLDRLADSGSELARQWDLDHDRHVFGTLVAVVRPNFETKTWEAFEKFAVQGRRVRDVAAELGMDENAVIQAKSRILKRLRVEAGELLDEPSN
jgi:RNA polymerase sigma-70 factor (ECF subfamily)